MRDLDVPQHLRETWVVEVDCDVKRCSVPGLQMVRNDACRGIPDLRRREQDMLTVDAFEGVRHAAALDRAGGEMAIIPGTLPGCFSVAQDSLSVPLARNPGHYQRWRPSPTTSQPRGEFPRLPPSLGGCARLTSILRPFRSVPFSP